MPTSLPPSSGFTGAGVTEGDFKSAITALRAYLSGLFGDTGATPLDLPMVTHSAPLQYSSSDSPALTANVVLPSMVSVLFGSMVMTPVPVLRTLTLKPSAAVAAANRLSVQDPVVQSISLPLSAATTL